jgi:hypothetical protein
MIAPADKIFIGWSDGVALHWPDDPYTISGNVTLIARWELASIGEIEAYLDRATGGGAANPIPLPVNLALGGGGWEALLSALDTADKYVALNLSDSAITGMSGTAGEFDPGTANTGEKYIVSLILPGTATRIKVGTYDNPTFKNFTALTSVTGIGVTAVHNCAFYGCASLAELSLPAVTCIGNRSFAYCTSLTEVNLPEAKSISNGAFEYGTSLTEVNLPVAISIGASAFYGCASLATVSFPAAVCIDMFAFWDCTSLAELSLPAALTTMGYNPFRGCVNLTTITVDPGNAAFKAQGGMLLNKAGTTLIAYPAAAGMVTLDSVTAISDYAFDGCRSLATVSLPVAVSIGNFAFWDCTSLAELSLPAAASIGDYAFYYCTSLAELSLPAVTSIGDEAFSGCTSLAELGLPMATSIGSAAFAGCASLVELSLPMAVSIGYGAFIGCESLTKLSLPAAAFIDSYAFWGCTSLTELSLPVAPLTVGRNMFLNINAARTITVKVLSASVNAYNTTWQTAFKGVGGSASALNTGDNAGTENTNITLILLAQYDDVSQYDGVSANVTLWANEDGGIPGSPQDMRISKTASGNPGSFTVTVAGAYTLVQWQVNGVPLGSLGNPLAIAAADYAAGKTYILGVQVTKDGVPYSTDIRFTVEA